MRSKLLSAMRRRLRSVVKGQLKPGEFAFWDQYGWGIVSAATCGTPPLNSGA